MNSLKAQRRIPNFEILRVVAMFLIIVGHFFVHGICGKGNDVNLKYDGTSMIDTLSFGITQSLWVISSISVNLYVLISGYFLIQSKAKWSKIPTIWLQTVFYSVCIYLVLIASGGVNFNVVELLRSLFVIKFGAVSDRTYWFVTQYIGLLAVSPFLNRMVSNFTKAEYRRLLLVLIVMDFSFGCVFYGDVYSGGQTLFHFITVYFIAGYIRLYHLFDTVSLNKLIGAFAMCVLALVVLDYLYCFVHCFRHHEPFQLLLSQRYLNYNGIPLILATLVFCIIKRVKFGDNCVVRFLVAIAPFSFGVYLIHDNIYVRNHLWRTIVSNLSLEPANIMGYCLIIAVTIYVICTVVDYLRSILFRVLKVNNISYWIVSLATRAIDIVHYR